MTTVKWKSKPAAHDYPAADSYLSLLVADPALRAELVAQLQAAPVLRYKAKDLLRASALPLLTKANAHVALDLAKIRKKQPLSPVLLVRGDLVRGFPLQVADGYHRICASHLVDESTDIPCRLIDLPAVVAAAAPTRPPVTRSRARAAVVETTAPAEPAATEPPTTKVAAARRTTAPRRTSAASKTLTTSLPAKRTARKA